MTHKDMAHMIFGDGQPIFLWLHGWGQDRNSLMRLAKLFEKRGKHVLLDLPGFGESPMLDKGAGTKDYADAVVAWLGQNGLNSPCIILGHSFGARVATQIAAHYPNSVNKLVYLAGAGLKRKRSIGFKVRAIYLKILGKMSRLFDKLFKTTYYQTYATKYGSRDYKAAGDLRPTFVKVVNENLIAEAESINQPALLIYGSNDNEAPPEIGKKYASLMKNAQYHELQGYGHLDILDRGAYQCQALINAFLDEVDT